MDETLESRARWIFDNLEHLGTHQDYVKEDLQYGLDHNFYDQAEIDAKQDIFLQNIAPALLAIEVPNRGLDRLAKWVHEALDYGVRTGLFDQETIDEMDAISRDEARKTEYFEGRSKELGCSGFH